MNTYLNKINWQKNKKWIIGIVAVAVLLVVFIGNKNNDEGIAKYTITKGDVIENLILNGEVDPVFGAEMAFSVSGTVDHIYKNAGDSVYLGEKIAELDNDGLRADLADAVATLELVKAEAKISNAELDRDVTNAYTRLLSDDLVAYTKDLNNDSTAPEVSGSYTGGMEGEYRISVEPSNYGSKKSFKYSGIESGETVIVHYKAVPVGTNGLFLKFAEGQTSAGDVWRISIPNVQGDSYIENLNAYNSALASRDAAENSNVSTDISNAKIKQAEAGVARIQADINERTIRAPFAGVVSKMDVKLGEIAEAGKVVTGVISEGSYEVVVEVPEIDIVNLAEGLTTDIVLDAYGKEVIFKGMLTSIDPAETEVDGVSVYRAKVSFTEPDARIRSGMTASVSILKNKKEGVLSMPSRFIDTDETGEFVLVQNLETETNDKVYVVLGLKGSDGNIEVVSGVKEGDVIIGDFEK